MIEPPLSSGQHDRLTAIYAAWLDQDDLGQRYLGMDCDPRDIGATSVRHLLARMQDPDTASRRFRASDSLLEFLKGL